MNALTQTAFGIASALTGRPRKAQIVTRVASRTWGGLVGGKIITDYIVLVGGNYYDVGQHHYDGLLGGASPEDLWLEPLSDADCALVDAGTYWPED